MVRGLGFRVLGFGGLGFRVMDSPVTALVDSMMFPSHPILNRRLVVAMMHCEVSKSSPIRRVSITPSCY